MAERTEYTAGTFSWVDLATTDPDGAKAFYGELFGWQFIDMPTPMGVNYSLAMKQMKPVAAITAQPPQRQGAPPAWNSYVTVPVVDDVTARVTDLAGSVVMPPMDVMTAGRMAVLQDPTGGHLCLWQAGDHVGAGLVNEHGTLTWNELMTDDVDGAVAFYTGLFGWTSEPFGDSYTVFMNGERAAGGTMAIDEAMGPMPPHWAVYFAVDDCDDVQEKAVALGGSVRMPPTDFPEVGRCCALADPAGGGFAVIKLLNPPD
jgi:predicted enzyme related to lactoylglutathione lyase